MWLYIYKFIIYSLFEYPKIRSIRGMHFLLRINMDLSIGLEYLLINKKIFNYFSFLKKNYFLLNRTVNDNYFKFNFIFTCFI